MLTHVFVIKQSFCIPDRFKKYSSISEKTLLKVTHLISTYSKVVLRFAGIKNVD